MKITLGFLYREQFGQLPSIDSMRTDLSGKTVIVLGANAGLGLECTRHIASMMGHGAGAGAGAGRLILACRNVPKAQAALESIRETTGFKGGEVWAIDLMDFASVSAFADRFEREGDGHLDLLIENSGIATRQYKKTKDGWESTVQTNHLGTALLAFLMLPYLMKAPPSPPGPRLTIVASDMHYFSGLNSKELDAPNILIKLSDQEYCTPSVMRKRYIISKLLNVFFMRAFSSRLNPASPLVVNAVNPGYCRSGLNEELRGKFFERFILWFSLVSLARPTEEGGRTVLHSALTVDPEKALSKKDANDINKREQLRNAGPKALHGKYITCCEMTEESDFVISVEGKKAQDRLWVSVRYTPLRVHNV